jgi:hypothetical protein
LEPQGRFQVARWAESPEREERMKGAAFKPLCFGAFHLGPQVKVTWPPGRDPALSNTTFVKRRPPGEARWSN